MVISGAETRDLSLSVPLASTTLFYNDWYEDEKDDPQMISKYITSTLHSYTQYSCLITLEFLSLVLVAQYKHDTRILLKPLHQM